LKKTLDEGWSPINHLNHAIHVSIQGPLFSVSSLLLSQGSIKHQLKNTDSKPAPKSSHTLFFNFAIIIKTKVLLPQT